LLDEMAYLFQMTNLRVMQHDNAAVAGGGEDTNRFLLGRFGRGVVLQLLVSQ